MTVALHWFRRDLRLTDNTALNAALAAHDQVLPVYVVSEWQKHHRWTGAPRQEFLCGCLASLARNLEAKGGRLCVARGQADAELLRLAREVGATAIYFNRDPDPFGRAMEEKVARAAQAAGVAVHAFKDHAMHEQSEVLTGSEKPFRVFTPYAKAWMKLDKAAPGKTVSRLSSPKAKSEPLPTLATWGLTSDAEIIAPGEAAARKRLAQFLDGPLFSYSAKRDLPADGATSRLSQDLRYGTLSIREIYARVQEATAAAGSAERKRSAQIYVNELIWREFYMQVLWHWPEVLEHEFQEDYRGLRWSSDKDALDRWCAGQTGFPIVDAGLRQLNATGFMHNRVRMIVAMFLTKDLHLDWRLGERFFMQRLVDGEIASNNGGWQWSASTGTDAAPYFRIQNPWAQTERFDPEGEYVRRWVPELRDVPAKRFVAPPEDGAALAKNYPAPMVDHSREREVALAMYRK